MLRRFVLAVAVAMSSAALAGCGNSAGLFPVSGKVLYRGEPAAGAVVYFHRQAKPGSASQTIPYGIVEDDGSFEVTSDDLGNGASPGSYIVLVEWRDYSGDNVTVTPSKGKGKGKVKQVKRSRIRSGSDRLKGRYFDISKPLLHAEVKAEKNPLAPFELTD
jgi:hypothetical protein